MTARGWGVGHLGWLGVKVGLVALLLLPLEGFQAYVSYVFLPRARGLSGLEGERQIERGLAMGEMVRTLSIPLYAAAIPLLFWLSFRQLF